MRWYFAYRQERRDEQNRVVTIYTGGCTCDAHPLAEAAAWDRGQDRGHVTTVVLWWSALGKAGVADLRAAGVTEVDGMIYDGPNE